MNVTLQRQVDTAAAPFALEVAIQTATIDAGTTFHLPLQVMPLGQGKKYWVECCGYEVAATNPQELTGKVKRFLPGLISNARFPSYMFVARQAKKLFPVYTIGDDVYATTPGGPVFRHVELAKVREYLSDYLHEANLLGTKDANDKLHVRGVSMRTLRLRRPIFYLKKRVLGEIDFWAPVFESGEGERIYTYAANERREVPISAGLEVLLLRQVVANALYTHKRLQNRFDLRPDRIFPAYWERLEATLTAQPPLLVKGIELPVYRNGRQLLALERRPAEQRYSLYLGDNEGELKARVTADFNRRGINSVMSRSI